ncbi:MAG: hypothetical protein ACYCV7_13350 [Acidimicrobiales bacterium]
MAAYGSRSPDREVFGSLAGSLRPIDRAAVAVAAAETELFAGSFMRGIVRYVAPIQIVLDCASQAGQVADDAIKEVTSW